MLQVVQDRGRHDETGGPPRVGAVHQGFPPPLLPPGSSVVPALPLLRSRRRLARSSTGVGVGLALGVLEEVSPGELDADEEGFALGSLLGVGEGFALGSLLGC